MRIVTTDGTACVSGVGAVHALLEKSRGARFHAGTAAVPARPVPEAPCLEEPDLPEADGSATAAPPASAVVPVASGLARSVALGVAVGPDVAPRTITGAPVEVDAEDDPEDDPEDEADADADAAGLELAWWVGLELCVGALVGEEPADVAAVVVVAGDGAGGAGAAGVLSVNGTRTAAVAGCQPTEAGATGACRSRIENTPPVYDAPAAAGTV